jgi:hypothetical protein
MFALPGGVASSWQANEDSVLWVATDEPTLAFEGVRPALVLALHRANCASTIGGKTLPWTPYVTLLTPAGAEHDHRNAKTDGAVTDDDIALALIVQDGGLYYYGRTMGFAFA